MSGDGGRDALAVRAERLLQARRGSADRLCAPEPIGERERSLVVRCAVAGWPGVDSVVVKRNRGDDERGFTDWAGLVFLSIPGATEGIAPRFYAGEPSERVLVMEDLGGSLTLADLLEDADERSVVDALRGLARPMTRLIATTRGREAEWIRTRAALPAGVQLGRRKEIARWVAGLESVSALTAALGVRAPPGMGDAVRGVARAYEQPGSYLAFSHGDPAPSNNPIAEGSGRVHLVDFEYAGYRHALYDATAWSVLCPLPVEWVSAFRNAFGAALSSGGAASLVAEPECYQEAWGTMCAYRALAMLSWFPDDTLHTDAEWAPGWSARRALISTCIRLRDATRGIEPLEPLAELGERMSLTLRSRWPEFGDGAIVWPARSRPA